MHLDRPTTTKQRGHTQRGFTTLELIGCGVILVLLVTLIFCVSAATYTLDHEENRELTQEAAFLALNWGLSQGDKNPDLCNTDAPVELSSLPGRLNGIKVQLVCTKTSSRNVSAGKSLLSIVASASTGRAGASDYVLIRAQGARYIDP